MRAFHLPHYLILLTIVTSCASFEKITAANEAINIQHSKETDKLLTQRVKDEAAQVESNLILIQVENYDYYAPATWKKIKSNLTRMRVLVNEFDPNDQGFFGGPSESKVLESIRLTQASIDKAQQSKKRVNSFLAQSLADITYLEPKIDAAWQADFEDIKADLAGLIADLEDDEVIANHQDSRDKLQQKMHLFEISIVRKHSYIPLQAKLIKLDNQLIPRSYEQVEHELQLLDNIITQSPRDQKKLAQAANLVENGIQRAQHIITDVNWINGLTKSQRENIVLHYRNGLEALSLKLLNMDLSTLSYQAQIDEFGTSIEAKIKHNKVLKMQQLNEQTTEIEQLKSQLLELHADTAKTVTLTVSDNIE